MNKRIAELANKAGLSHMPSNYPDMADLYKGADFELEKFAELIVRECADLFEVEWGSSMLQGTTAAHYLKQHFGVEE